ncbi:MAG: helix-turn-helix domain-containing protein, partial [Actinomycetota bacterium]
MSQRLTTDSVAPGDRLDYWRESICAVYVELDAEPQTRESFAGSIDWTLYGPTTISRVQSDGQVVTRRTNTTSTDCLVSLQLAGLGRVSQAGAEAVLRPGDFALYDATEPYELAFEGSFQQLVVQFPRNSLIARNVHLHSTVARSHSGRTGVGAVAMSLVRSLSDQAESIDAPTRAELGLQVIDVVASALSATPSDAAVATLNRRRILDHVAHNLDDPGLSVASLARTFGVSARTLQKLFSDDGAYLSEHIRTMRLLRAAEALDDPRRAHQTITQIAHEAGFGGPTQLSRRFR